VARREKKRWGHVIYHVLLILHDDLKEPTVMDFDPDTHPVRITTSGKIKTWVNLALDFLDENEERSLTFHTLPPPGTPPSAKTSTTTIPRLISVVEIVKREHLERLKARRSSSLTGVHQYNEVGALQDLPSPPVPSPDAPEMLSGRNVRIKKTVFMKVTLSRKKLQHLLDRGATYQQPLVRTLSKSAKARARSKKRKAAVIVESMTVEM